jgi:homoserine dehydrogenase
VQKQEANGQTVPVVFLTHTAQLKNVASAMAEISRLEFIKAPTVHYRLL